MKLFGAIDLHSNNNVTVLIDERDEVVYRKRLPNDLRLIIEQLSPYQSTLQGIVVESTYNCVQFFFNETKSKDEVSRFWLWDSHRENPVGDVEKRLPYLPQDRRSRSDPYLGIPPR